MTLTFGIETLAGFADLSADLGGYGPILADIARRIAVEQWDGAWDYIVTDHVGHPVMTGTTRRRPSAGQRRDVISRNRVCVFPGCRHPARGCDLDHTEDWVRGGPTEVENLAPLCRHDHRLKHGGWQVAPLGSGTYRWTSPLGHTYITHGQSP